MLTKNEITTASATLDAVDVEMWLALIRANTYYRGNKFFYPDVQFQLEEANGTAKGQMLNAILDKIEALGVGEVSIRNGDEGLNYSQSQERDALVKYALSVLYDATEIVYQTDTSGAYGQAQVRQRGYTCPCCFNYYCSSTCPLYINY
jgi:hypothetical protein